MHCLPPFDDHRHRSQQKHTLTRFVAAQTFGRSGQTDAARTDGDQTYDSQTV